MNAAKKGKNAVGLGLETIKSYLVVYANEKKLPGLEELHLQILPKFQLRNKTQEILGLKKALSVVGR